MMRFEPWKPPVSSTGQTIYALRPRCRISHNYLRLGLRLYREMRHPTHVQVWRAVDGRELGLSVAHPSDPDALRVSKQQLVPARGLSAGLYEWAPAPADMRPVEYVLTPVDG